MSFNKKMMKRLIKKANQTAKIKQSLKNKINSDLHKWNTTSASTYFDKIPLQQIFDELKKYNIIVVDEEGSNWSGMLLGNDSYTKFDLVLEENFEKKPIENSMLILSWYKFDDWKDENDKYQKGKYEIVAYLS